MKEEIFNPKVFLEVIEANVQMLCNEIQAKAKDKAILMGNPIMTDDQTRELANDFFNLCLSQKITTVFKNKI